MTMFTNLRFECPATGQMLDYEVPGDAGTLKDLWARTLLRSCRLCGCIHRISFRAAYVAGILEGLRSHSAEEDCGGVARNGHPPA